MEKFENYSDNLVHENDFIFSKKENKISYPKDGNEKDFKLEENSFWFNHRANCIIQIVKKFAPNDLFFDLGGGNGLVSAALEKNHVPTVLVEPGLEGCMNARKRGLKNIICSTYENTGFKKNTLSSIGLFDVLEHIEDDNDFLQSIHHTLKENGFIFITVPAYNALWSNEDKDVGHFRRYSLKQLEKKLTTSGFKIEYSTYIFSILPVFIFLFRTLLSKIGLNKNSGNLKKLQKEHTNNKVITGILNQIWKIELARIKKQKRILFGGSCLVIAKKNS